MHLIYDIAMTVAAFVVAFIVIFAAYHPLPSGAIVVALPATLAVSYFAYKKPSPSS